MSFMLSIIAECLANVKSFYGVFPEIFVLAVEQCEEIFGVVVTMSRKQSVDHILTNALLRHFSRVASRVESVDADDVFLILHAFIIHH